MGGIMPLYVTLYNFTDQGVRNIKDAPKRIQDGIKAFEKMGGKMIGFYATVGPYDYVTIGEAPNDEVAAGFALAIGSAGNVRSTSMRAFTPEEFAKVISKIP
jgi:uncharacterized protein with GYD domain